MSNLATQENKTHYANTTYLGEKETFSTKRLDIFSTNSSRRNNIIVKTMLKCFEDFHNCHHAIPGGGIHQILKSLQVQLQDYTMEDFCVLLIGEQDLRRVEDCDTMALMHEISSTLETITNTNVIICTPTYVCGAPIYNYRVELFNTRLNQHLQMKKCAHFYDSNLNLTFDMFSSRTGKITNSGIKNIFENIKCIVTDIEQAVKDSNSFRA